MRTLPFLAAALVGLFACDAGSPADEPSDGVTPPDTTATGTPAAAGALLFPVVQDGDRALIDSTGRIVVSLDGYNAVRAGGEGLVPARRWRDGRSEWSYFDANGAVAFTVAADEAYAPSGGLARVRVDGRSGYVDRVGRFVVNPYMNDARSVHNGLARVKPTGNRWGFMNPTGRIVVEPEWDDLQDLSDGRARFRDGDAYGFIDASGREAIEPVYADARSFSGGLAAVREGQSWYYVDPQNDRVMGSTTFISAGDFSEGLAPARTENQWEYIDAAGQRVIAPAFDEARAFSQGRAAVRIDGRWTFIDRSGAPLRAPEFDEVSDFENGLARVEIGGKVGYVSRDGSYVWIPRD